MLKQFIEFLPIYVLGLIKMAWLILPPIAIITWYAVYSKMLKIKNY